MSRISSSVGLITGIPIEETVTKLMEVAARPRDMLKSRNDALKLQQSALDTIGSRLLAFQFAVNKLKSTTLFQTREVSSSNENVLNAALPATGTPIIGSYQVRPVRTASSQQLVSQTFSTANETLGSGVLSFHVGGHVDKGVLLEQLNGGAGVQRGKIRITDRSGASTTIDLSTVRSVDDVLAAINSNTDVSVSASTTGDSFTLTDNSGGTGNLRVQEVGGGTTAAALGLAGLNVAASQTTGSDVLRLHAGSKLTLLNDGNGVEITKEGVVDIVATLADGSELAIDLHDAATLGDVIAQINAASPTKLLAAIAADGRRLTLTDLTTGAGEFQIANGAASSAAADLGIVAETTGATIAGERLTAGLRDSLLSRLNGGQGVGPLGNISITDRNGASATVDLSAAETLDDVISLINAATSEVTAAFNASRNGIVVNDLSGGTGTLTIADADSTDTATALKIAIADAVESVNSGALGRQTLSRATLLTSLNGGKGVALGDIRITDGAGVTATADLDSVGAKPTTIGDVIDGINALSNGIEARINGTGDGILLVDTTAGSNTLGVKDVAGNIAKSLNLTRASATIEVDGSPTQAIDGTTTYSIDLDELEVDDAAVPLDSLNGGKGVAAGDFVITDSRGRLVAIDLNGADSGVSTVGQLIELINLRSAAAGAGVTARVNASGTGILLEDAAGGTGTLTVRDVNSTTAADLKLTGKAVGSGGRQTIDGFGTFSATNAAATGLQALASRINGLDAGVTASAVFDGSGYRLSLSANATGSANELVLDATGTGLSFTETSQARDALLLYGNLAVPGAGVLLSSPDGEFAGAVGGADVTVKGVSNEPVTVNVTQTNSAVVDAMVDLVEAYNSLRTDLRKLTAFDPDAATTGLLFGSNEALQIDTRLSQALTARYFGLGDLQSLEQVGLSVNDDGTLALDEFKLQSAFELDPDGVEQFVTDRQNGVAIKISAVIDRLAGTDSSLLAARSDTLQASIAANDDRLTRLNDALTRQQERLFAQFYQLETLIAKMQTSLTAIQNLQVVPPLTSARSSS